MEKKGHSEEQILRALRLAECSSLIVMAGLAADAAFLVARTIM